MEIDEDVYVDILDESPVDKGKVDVECGEFDRWDGGGGSVSATEDSDHCYGYSRYRNVGGEYGGSASYKVRSVVSVAEVYMKDEAENEVAGLSSRHGRELDDNEKEKGQVSGRSGKFGFGSKERKRNYRRRNVDGGDSSGAEDTGKFNVHESADKESKRNYRLRKVVDGDLSDGENDKLTRKFNVNESGDKGFKRNYRLRNVDDGDSSGEEDEEQNTRRGIVHESKDKERERNYRRGKVNHDEFSDEMAQEEELVKGKHIKRGSGDKAHSRSYRHASLVDDDYNDDKVKEEQFPKKLAIHGSGDKEHTKIYGHRRVVDNDYSDNEVGEQQISRKPFVHGYDDKEQAKIYGHRRVVDNDHSDKEVEARQFSRKPIVSGSGDKEHTKIYGHRRGVDYDYSDNKVEERQITSKTIECGSADKQHRRNSKRRREVGDDTSDNEFEFVGNHSKECDDSVGQELHSRRILSRHHSNSRDETVSEDNIEKDRDGHRHRDDSHERNHQHDKHLRSRHRYDTGKEGEGDPNVDKYKRGSRDPHHNSKYNSENDDEADDLERRPLKKESAYHHMKERGRNDKEEKTGRGPEIHHFNRHQIDDYAWETLIIERKRDYVFSKERGNDAEEDKYNRKLRGARHSARYQNEHDDWETKIMEKERCSLERGKEMFDIYEMKNKGRDKYHDFRGHGKDTFTKTSLMEIENEGELRGKGEDFLKEGQEFNGHVQGRMGRKEMNFIERDLRAQITEGKEKSHRRELKDLKHGRKSMEQQNQSLDMSLKRELKEQKKETNYRGHDREFFRKGKETHRNKDDKVESWKLHFSESTINKREKKPIGMISEKEKVHTVIRKKDLSDRDITSRENSHKSKQDRGMEEIISKRDIWRKDLRKQDMEDRMHVVRETGSDDYNMHSREASHEIEWDVETGQRYERKESMSSDKREREGRHTILVRNGECRLTEQLQKMQDKKKQEDYQERRGLNKEGMETTRRHLVERGTWKPDIEIREQSMEMEALLKENEKYLMTGDISKEKNRQNEHLNKAEEKLCGENDNRSHWKTWENDSVDNENQRDIITWEMEKCQRKELFNKEEVKNRRECVRTSLEDNLEKDLLDKSNERCPVVRNRECREKSTKTTEEEAIKELTEEKEKCREQHKETKILEPEADAGTELERQQKTVLAYQISTEANDRDLYNFFSKAGKVRDVRLVLDPISRHFIGVGYIEFWCSLSIPIAISLSGKLLHGQPVLVKPPETGENQLYLPEKAAGSNYYGPCSRVSKRLCVGNLHDSVTEALLHQVFKSYGMTELVQFDSAEAGHCERKCIIQFARPQDASAALSLNGHLALAGQLVKVSSINDYEEVLVLGADTNDCNKAEDSELVSDTGVQNEMQLASADTNCFKEADGNDMVSDSGVQNETQRVDKTIDSNEEKGSSMLESESHNLGSNGSELNKSSSPVNALLSGSLEHPLPLPSIEAFLTSLKAVLLVPSAAIPIVDTVGVPSECLHLKNIFDSNMQASDEFELRVKEDVGELCYKFGKPLEIHVDKNSAGCVYLRFEDTPAAIVVQRALHGAWFAGKMITATYMDRQSYDAKFPNLEQASTQGLPPAWLPHNNGPGFPITEYTLTQGLTPAMQPLTCGTNFPTSQQHVATSTMWLPNNNHVAFGAGFGNGGQFMLPVPLVPQGNIFPEMRPNAW